VLKAKKQKVIDNTDRRWRTHAAKTELKEVEYTIKSIDQLAERLTHNRELAVMRRDMLLKTICENKPV
jgi:hypothetical protein